MNKIILAQWEYISDYAEDYHQYILGVFDSLNMAVKVAEECMREKKDGQIELTEWEINGKYNKIVGILDNIGWKTLEIQEN